MPAERIDKILSGQGVATRSEAKALIRRGLVCVNGVTVKKPDEKYDPASAEITVGGKSINFRKNLYIMMNKPAGVLSASRDSHAETVLDLLPPQLRRSGLFPAGRLDKDTTGFILITDDGELAHRMLSPKNHVYKLYEAECDRALSEEDEKRFAEGLESGDVVFLPAEMKITGENRALVEICEGKFHQVKRMFSCVGAEVTALRRLRIGEVYLDEMLSPGECRELRDEEIIGLLSQKHGIFE